MTSEQDEFIGAVRRQLAAELPAARKLRRRIHREPETGWQEHRTGAAIAAALADVDGVAIAPVAETGLLVRVGRADGPAIGVRAELDGLPLRELTGASFASANGAMHACGHDVHMAGLVALLRSVGKVAADLAPSAALLGVFQPSEEAAPSGAQAIVKTGRLQEHGVAAMLAVHVHGDVADGAVGTGAGPVNAASGTFTLTVTGTGGHGAYPQHSRDPVMALSSVIVALQQVVSRRSDPMHPTVVSVTRLRAGSAANVIPAEAVAEGTVRVLRQEDREQVFALIRDVATHTAAASGCRAQVDVVSGDPALVNDARLAAATDRWLTRHGFALDEPMRSCGSDDFAEYLQVAPLLMMFLGVGDPSRPGRPGLHHPEFLPAEDKVDAVAYAMLSGLVGAAEPDAGPAAPALHVTGASRGSSRRPPGSCCR